MSKIRIQVKLFKLGFAVYFCIISIACGNNTFAVEGTKTKIYDATLFQKKPDLSSLGIESLKILYTRDLWPNNADMEEPHEIKFISTITKHIKNKVDLICIDIEHWPIDNSGAETIKESIRKYRLVADWAHRASSTLRIGYYGTLPKRNYWGPIGNAPQEILSWENTNAQLAPISEKVDIIFPSLYTFYDNPDEWVIYAIANLKEAKKYGKPVYAFIWPQYHNSNKILGGDYISGDFWRIQLETVYKYADAIVIWGGNKQEWNDNSPWWQQTKIFLTEINKIELLSSPLKSTPNIDTK